MTKPKPKKDHRADGHRTVQVKVDLAKALTHVAVDNGLTLTDLIDSVLRHWVEGTAQRLPVVGKE